MNLTSVVLAGSLLAWSPSTKFVLRGRPAAVIAPPAPAAVVAPAPPPSRFSSPDWASLHRYIQASWSSLTRTEHDLAAVARDPAWLASTLPAIRSQYHYWTTPPHLAGSTGLSRYHALGSGPAPEVRAVTRDATGRDYYQRMAAALESAPAHANDELARYYDRRHHRLTPLAYVADRSARESGFHQTDPFGAYSLGIIDFAPVCLNSLLLAMERDMATILTIVGGEMEAQDWWRLAERRRQRLNALLRREAEVAELDSSRRANGLGSGWTDAVVLLLEAGQGTGAGQPAAAAALKSGRAASAIRPVHTLRPPSP